MDVKSLRASRNTDFSKITSEFDKAANPETRGGADNRFWKPERDKAGNGTATIRFLARTEGDELPWAKVFSHGFQGPSGRWLIDNCLTTLGQACPVCELNTQLWNSTSDSNSPARKQVSQQKRKLNYIANILVVSDPKHPENNGKVFLFKFGKKIFDKIMDKARPTFEDEKPVNVFDYWEGANFKLRIKTVDRYPNYDSSEWEAESAIAETDEEILEVVKQQYKLSEFLDPSAFKSYADLKTRLATTLGGEAVPSASSMKDDDLAVFKEVRKPAAPPTRPAPAPRGPAPVMVDDDDENTLEYFKKLAE